MGDKKGYLKRREILEIKGDKIFFETLKQDEKKTPEAINRKIDTDIKKDINERIVKGIKTGNLNFKINLCNKYPDRTDYIIKMINHWSEKLKLGEQPNDGSDDELGDNR